MALKALATLPLIADSPFDLPNDLSGYAIGQEFRVISTGQSLLVTQPNNTPIKVLTPNGQPLPSSGSGATPDGTTIVGAGTSASPLHVGVGVIGDTQLAAPNRAANFDAAGAAAAAIAHTDAKLPAATPIDMTGATDGQVATYILASGKVLPRTPQTGTGGVVRTTRAQLPAPSTSNAGALFSLTDAGLKSDQVNLLSDGVTLHDLVPEFNFLTFGADPTGQVACDSAWTAMMAAVKRAGSGMGTTVRIPRGFYKFTASAYVTSQCRIVGDGVGGADLTGAVQLIFPPGVAGLVFQSITSTSRADFSILDSVTVTCPTIPIGPPAWQASQAYTLGTIVRPTVHNRYTYVCTQAGTSAASEPTWPFFLGEPSPASETVTDGGCVWQCQWASGIVVRQRVRIENCIVNGFEGDGISVYGDVGYGSNANGWYVGHTRIQACNGNGLVAHGGDSNAGTAFHVDVDLSNPQAEIRGGMAGIAMDVFINSTVIGCQVAWALGPAYACRGNAAVEFIGCYSEVGGNVGDAYSGANGPAQMASPGATVIGGFLACGYTSDSVGRIIGANDNYSIVNSTTYGLVSVAGPSYGSMVAFQAPGEANTYRLNFDATGARAGWYNFNYGGSDSARLIYLSGSQSSVGAGKLLLPTFYTGRLTDPTPVNPRDGYFQLTVSGLFNNNMNFDGTVPGYFRRRVEWLGAILAPWSVTVDAAYLTEAWYWNHTPQTMTIKSVGAGASISLASGMACWISHDGTNIRRMTPALDPTV